VEKVCVVVVYVATHLKNIRVVTNWSLVGFNFKGTLSTATICFSKLSKHIYVVSYHHILV